MNTPDEIKRGLWCCTHNSGCDACPYRDISVGCRPARNADALALIQRLEVDNSQLRNYIRLLQTERDAAVRDLTEMAQDTDESCEYCKMFKTPHCSLECRMKNKGFEWRGVQKEE